ncbi:hypothetical protein CVULP_0840 [Campylobacter vulpis]|nr:hypothetical protein AA995_07355 [Campylobacter vulpis]QNF77873.1 hypothetical protein CVULP_0840 [Campylobacter vulpis]
MHLGENQNAFNLGAVAHFRNLNPNGFSKGSKRLVMKDFDFLKANLKAKQGKCEAFGTDWA